MISNPDLIIYACIAKGPTILSEFISSKSKEAEPGIEVIAKKCIEKTPPHHSLFSHTVRKKTYSFLINDPFAYFVIFHENLEKSESFWFLNRLNIAFQDFLSSNPSKDFDNLSYHCFQDQFYPVFRHILSLDTVGLLDSMLDDDDDDARKSMTNPSVDSNRGKRSVVRPLLSKPAKLTMKKKKRQALGCVGCASDEGNVLDNNNNNNNNNNNKVNYAGDIGNVVLNREFSVAMHKNGGGAGGFFMGDGKQKAKQIWRKHVWVVLILDLVICSVLFGIWLWVCRGFKCIDG